MRTEAAEAPQVLHASYVVADQWLGDTEEEVHAQIRERMTRILADKLADALYDAKGGYIVSPITFSINSDETLNVHRIQGTINAQRLPDPESEFYYLYGGRMHGRSIRLGAVPPRIYRIPWAPPVGIYSTERTLILDYERVPGTQAYRFVSESALP